MPHWLNFPESRRSCAVDKLHETVLQSRKLAQACRCMQEILRARHLSLGQISALEEAWRENPAATIDNLQKPGEDQEPPTVALRQAADQHRLDCHPSVHLLQPPHDPLMTDFIPLELCQQGGMSIVSIEA